MARQRHFRGRLPLEEPLSPRRLGLQSHLPKGGRRWRAAATSAFWRSSDRAFPGVRIPKARLPGCSLGAACFCLSTIFDNTGGYVTGVAVANTNPTQSLSISLTFHMQNGTQAAGSLLLAARGHRSEEHTSELQSPCNLVC